MFYISVEKAYHSPTQLFRVVGVGVVVGVANLEKLRFPCCEELIFLDERVGSLRSKEVSAAETNCEGTVQVCANTIVIITSSFEVHH